MTGKKFTVEYKKRPKVSVPKPVTYMIELENGKQATFTPCPTAYAEGVMHQKTARFKKNKGKIAKGLDEVLA